jgi:hypothetical protein
MEGKYRVSVRTYVQEDHQVTAEFVEGVLISFGVSGS